MRSQAIYRACLLPHPRVDSVQSLSAYVRASWLPLLVFVFSHVLNPRAMSRKTFQSWKFLSLAAVLGAGCTAVYWLTNGCLWAPVVVHWVVEIVWLCALGGAYRIRIPTDNKHKSA